ncbi:Sec1/munc18-like proteins superfamily [Perilla frutescens var. frutescens]|nr:Sec1/munc18-like proteins superfamily [Perilla frutescens var. frutescens]
MVVKIVPGPAAKMAKSADSHQSPLAPLRHSLPQSSSDIDPPLASCGPATCSPKHGAELRHLTAEPFQTENTKVVFLVRAQSDLMRFICSHIHNDTSKGLHREYFLYFVPRRLILEEEKVHELLNIGEFPLYMLPLDEDVLSFELDLAEKEYLVDGDGTALWHIAKAIHNLEFSFGVIPNVRAKGKASARVADILTRMQTEEPANTSNVINLCL